MLVFLGPVRAIDVMHSLFEVEEFPPTMGLSIKEGRKFEHPGIAIIMVPCRKIEMPIGPPVQLGAVYGQAAVGLVSRGDTLVAICEERSSLVKKHWAQVQYEALSKQWRGWVHIWSMNCNKPLILGDIGGTGCTGM